MADHETNHHSDDDMMMIIIKMINISSDQVYQSHQYPLFIDGRNRKKVFKQIKQDNHAQKMEETKLVSDEDN